jgi:hypothetical protein
MTWDPNKEEIYAGLSDLRLPDFKIELGGGILLYKTYAHIFGPYIAAFKEPENDGSNPGPWKSIGDGTAIEIRSELHIPKTAVLFKSIDRINSVWLIAALLRLQIIPFLRVPIISNIKFSEISNSKIEAKFHPIETVTHNLFRYVPGQYNFNIDSFQWVKKSIPIAGVLYERSSKYALALLSLDRSIFESRFSLALITLWGALERLFSPDDKQELGYRISLNIASFLEERGNNRVLLFKKVRKLYTARSRAAHGNPTEDSKEFVETYQLLKRAFIKMTNENHVPSKSDFELRILNN